MSGRNTRLTKKKKNPKPAEGGAAAPPDWSQIENEELERVLENPLKYQHVVAKNFQATNVVMPSDMVLTRILETVPLSAFATYLVNNSMLTIQQEFELWRSSAVNAELPLGHKALNKVCYIVFLYNYERIVTPNDVAPAAQHVQSLLQRMLSAYFSSTILVVANQQQALASELADDCGVPLEMWLRNRKFSEIGVVKMTDVDPDLTVANVLSQLQLFGVRHDPEVLSYGVAGMGDQAVISLILSSVANSVTVTQRNLINQAFNVDLSDRIHFNPVVNEIVQQFKLAYVSNTTNVRLGILPAS